MQMLQRLTGKVIICGSTISTKLVSPNVHFCKTFDRMLVLILLLSLSFQSNVYFKDKERNLIKDVDICHDPKNRLGCQINSYNAEELYKKYVHYFNRPGQPWKMEYKLTDKDKTHLDKTRPGWRSGQNKKKENIKIESECKSKDASDDPLKTVFIYGDDKLAKTFRTGAFNQKVYLGRPIYEVEAFFFQYNKTYFNFQYRKRKNTLFSKVFY